MCTYPNLLLDSVHYRFWWVKKGTTSWQKSHQGNTKLAKWSSWKFQMANYVHIVLPEPSFRFFSDSCLTKVISGRPRYLSSLGNIPSELGGDYFSILPSPLLSLVFSISFNFNLFLIDTLQEPDSSTTSLPGMSNHPIQEQHHHFHHTVTKLSDSRTTSPFSPYLISGVLKAR